MKKVFAFAAVMLVTVFAFVACNKDGKTEPETKWETPTVLMGTEWVYGEGTTFSYTLIFETGNTGVKKCHNEIPGGEVYDTQRDIKSYTYANGKGEYKDDKNDTFEFTIDGGTFTEYDPMIEDYLVYKRKK